MVTELKIRIISLETAGGIPEKLEYHGEYP